VLEFSEPVARGTGGQRHVAAVAPLPRGDEQRLLRDRLARWLATDAQVRIVHRPHVAADAVDGDDAVTRLVLLDLEMAGTEGFGPQGRVAERSSTIHVLVVPADFDKEPARLVQQDAERTDQPRDHRLSSREVHVLAQVAAGMSNKQIAKLLGISQKTVRNHLSRIFGKLSASNRTEAVMHAMRMGLPLL